MHGATIKIIISFSLFLAQFYRTTADNNWNIDSTFQNLLKFYTYYVQNNSVTKVIIYSKSPRGVSSHYVYDFDELPFRISAVTPTIFVDSTAHFFSVPTRKCWEFEINYVFLHCLLYSSSSSSNYSTFCIRQGLDFRREFKYSLCIQMSGFFLFRYTIHFYLLLSL
jgi:hypothetical protein